MPQGACAGAQELRNNTVLEGACESLGASRRLCRCSSAPEQHGARGRLRKLRCRGALVPVLKSARTTWCSRTPVDIGTRERLFTHIHIPLGAQGSPCPCRGFRRRLILFGARRHLSQASVLHCACAGAQECQNNAVPESASGYRSRERPCVDTAIWCLRAWLHINPTHVLSMVLDCANATCPSVSLQSLSSWFYCVRVRAQACCLNVCPCSGCLNGRSSQNGRQFCSSFPGSYH